MNRTLAILLVLLAACDETATTSGPDAATTDVATDGFTETDLSVPDGDIKERSDTTPSDNITLPDQNSNDALDTIEPADSIPDSYVDSTSPDALDTTDQHPQDLSDAADAIEDTSPDNLPPPDAVDLQEDAETSDVEEDLPDVTPPPCPELQDLEGITFSGTIYYDSDGSSDSFYHQTIAPAFDSPLEGIQVELRLPDGTTLYRNTCSNGAFSFGNLTSDSALSYVVPPEAMWPSTADNPYRFHQALLDGEITIVTLGDSIPSFGAQPFFPDRLEDLLSPFMLVHNINIAVPGTSTDDWKPGSNLLENEALPLVPEADLVIISLGGNDLNYWVAYDGELTPEEALELASDFPVVMEKVRTNLDATIQAIQAVNPLVDIAYIIYPNYADSSYWKEMAGSYISLVKVALANELGKTRKYFSRPGITIVDMLGATSLIDLDQCLSDPLHLNENGTHVWARHIFQALGGVILADPSLGTTRNTGFAPTP